MLTTRHYSPLIKILVDLCPRLVYHKVQHRGTFHVTSTMCVTRDTYGNMRITVVHEALYNNNTYQVEYLLSIHQALKLQGNGIGNCSESEDNICGDLGTQIYLFRGNILTFLKWKDVALLTVFV